MKCYIAIGSRGEYDSYREKNEKVFFDKSLAEKYIEIRNEENKLLNARFEICQKCPVTGLKELYQFTEDDKDYINCNCKVKENMLQYLLNNPIYYCTGYENIYEEYYPLKLEEHEITEG